MKIVSKKLWQLITDGLREDLRNDTSFDLAEEVMAIPSVNSITLNFQQYWFVIEQRTRNRTHHENNT